jgi:hypothetical protein
MVQPFCGLSLIVRRCVVAPALVRANHETWAVHTSLRQQLCDTTGTDFCQIRTGPAGITTHPSVM